MSGYQVNCPYQGTINADGTATIQAVEHDTYNISGNADYTITAQALDAANAYFALTQESLTDASGGKSAQLNVAVSNASGLAGVLANAFCSGSVTPFGQPASVSLIEAVLAAVHEASINASLASNGVNAALEASAVEQNGFDHFATDVSGGAASLASDMAADADDTLRLLATQLPASNYTTENFPSSIPFKSGDSMRIRFTVNSSFYISNEQVNLVPGVTPDAQVDPANGMGNHSDGVDADTWTIDLILTKA